jgi:heat shock protein HslJ
VKRLIVAVLAVLSLALAGTALASGTPSGKYRTVIKNTTILGGQLNGTWVINFTKGHYRVTQNGVLAMRGTDTIKGNVITFKETRTASSCNTAGKYRYTLSGNTLTFKRVSDSTSLRCRGRVNLLKRKFTKVFPLLRITPLGPGSNVPGQS